MSNIFFTLYIKIKKVKVVIKYKNLLDYGTCRWSFILMYIYKREISLMKINFVLFLHSNSSFLYSSLIILLFYNTLSTWHSEYIEKEKNTQDRKENKCSRYVCSNLILFEWNMNSMHYIIIEWYIKGDRIKHISQKHYLLQYSRNSLKYVNSKIFVLFY